MIKPDISKDAEIGQHVRFGSNVVVVGPTTIGDGVILGNNVIIYPNCHLEGGVEIQDNSVIGKMPRKAGSVARDIAQGLPPLCIGTNAIIGANCVIYTGSEIGPNSFIADLVSIREQCKIGRSVLVGRGTTFNYNAKIGDYTKIMDNTHITGDMVIEDHVFISTEVVTVNDNLMGRTEHWQGEMRGPYIKRGAMIGGNASILPNITVGEDALVGVGAVVTKDVPTRKLVLGVPARIVKDVPPEMWLENNL